MHAKHTIMDGDVNLYKRNRSKFWQCSTFLEGRNWRASTKETDIRKAKDFAEGWYLELRGKARHKELRVEKTFAEAAKQFKREYSIITQGQRNQEYVDGMMKRLDNYVIPFLGTKGLSQVTAGLVQEYRIHRQTYSIPRHNQTGEHVHKPPARSTMHQEIVALRQVLKTAVRHGWLSHVPDISMPYKTSGKVVRRAWFSPEEYKRLYKATRGNIGEAVNKRHKWNAQQLHDLVLFMANTGLRPDETKRLEYRDVTIVDDLNSGETILEIEVRGKRGVGYCKSTSNAVHVFERLVERNNPQPKDPVFPTLHRALFNRILEQEDLKVDREGQTRTAYSLRHTYICLRLMEGANIYQIAKNCRTSVEMIEKYYANHIKTMIDASAVNVRRRKPVTTKRETKYISE
jgi:integrase